MESSRRRSTIEIKLLSCKDLKAFNFFQKLSVYALVSLQVISSNNDPDKKVEQNELQPVEEQQMSRTPTDGEGDGNPEWNHEMRFEFDDEDQLKDCQGRCRLFIHFDLRHEGLGLLGIGDRSIGQVLVPLTDLIYIPPTNNDAIIMEVEENNLQLQQQHQRATFVNYQVRTSDEKPNGVLAFSYKLKLIMCNKQPRVQYPKITLEDPDAYTKKFNSQVCCPSLSSQSQSSSQQLQSQSQALELQQDYHHHHQDNPDIIHHSNISTSSSHFHSGSQQEGYTSTTSSAAPAHNCSQAQLHAADQQMSSWLPQYHHHHHHHIHHKYHNYDPPVVPPAPTDHHAYYPPPPPPPPPPMVDHGASYHPAFLPPPGVVHPPWPSHPYHDYGPWSPTAGIGRPHGRGHGHGHEYL